MSSLLNPLHPLTLFTALRKGKQTLITFQAIMPANSSFVVQLRPQPNIVWLTVVGTASIPRDFITGNPIYSPLVSAVSEHTMIRTMTNFALESFYLFNWATHVEVTYGEPITYTISNGTGAAVTWDFTLAIMEFGLEKYGEYLSLWRGLYNFEELLSNFSDEEIKALADTIKGFIKKRP